LFEAHGVKAQVVAFGQILGRKAPAQPQVVSAELSRARASILPLGTSLLLNSLAEGIAAGGRLRSRKRFGECRHTRRQQRQKRHDGRRLSPNVTRFHYASKTKDTPNLVIFRPRTKLCAIKFRQFREVKFRTNYKGNSVEHYGNHPIVHLQELRHLHLASRN
jgi:hypothetical protein